MLILLLNRIIHPVLKLISGPAEYASLAVGFPANGDGLYDDPSPVVPRMKCCFSLHMLAVDLLLIWIPISRISHFVFYFFARIIHGQEFGKRGVAV